MVKADKTPRSELLPGTLDMLILKTLTRGPLHGYGIARRIEEVSDAVLQVEEGSLYPALQRLRLNGWVEAEWAETERGRRALLPADGRRPQTPGSRGQRVRPAGRRHRAGDAGSVRQGKRQRAKQTRLCAREMQKAKGKGQRAKEA